MAPEKKENGVGLLLILGRVVADFRHVFARIHPIKLFRNSRSAALAYECSGCHALLSISVLVLTILPIRSHDGQNGLYLCTDLTRHFYQ